MKKEKRDPMDIFNEMFNTLTTGIDGQMMKEIIKPRKTKSKSKKVQCLKEDNYDRQRAG